VENAGQTNQVVATSKDGIEMKQFKHISQDDYDKSGTAIINGNQIYQESIQTPHDMVDDTKWYFWRAGVPQWVSIDAYYAGTTCPAQIRNFLRRVSLCGTSTTDDCMDKKIEKRDYYAETVLGKIRTIAGGSTSTVSDNHSMQFSSSQTLNIDKTNLLAGCAFLLTGTNSIWKIEDGPYYPLADGVVPTTDAEPLVMPFFVKKMKSGSSRTSGGYIKLADVLRTNDYQTGKSSYSAYVVPTPYQNQYEDESIWTIKNSRTCGMYCSDAVGKDAKSRFVFPSATDENYAAQSLCSDCSVADTITSYAGADDGVCKDCPPIDGAVNKTYTCSEPFPNQFKSVFVNAQDIVCTDHSELPVTTYVPHACLPKSNGCPAGFQVQNANCQSCSKDDALNTDANCKHKTGCACKFDVNFKSTNSTLALYELRPSGKCKFKSMKDLFEYGYSAYEDPEVKQGIITQIENITGSSVEEFVKQDYLLRKATIRVSLKNYDANVDGGGVKGYKYYNFAKTAADGEVWNDFVTAAPANKTGKIQDVGTICWIKPASTNDCIFDSTSSCDRTLTKAEYMTLGHNITANGATILTDDCNIIQFVEPLISTRVMSDDIPDTWESDLDITSSNGVDIIGTIIRGFVTDGTSHVMKDEVETKIAMHKLIGISSECIGSNADTHGRTTGNAENIFAWGDLQAKVKFNMVAKVELLRSEKGDPTDYIGAFQSGSASAVNDPTQMFDLLFVSGENVFNMPNTDLDEQTGLISFAALTNGPQSSFNQLLIEHTGFSCGTTLTITTSGGDFDCFGDIGSDATGDSAQTQTGAYFRTTLDSADYGHEWILQTNESDAAYASPVDFINSLAITGADNLHDTQPCTAEIQHSCGQRIMKVTDNRKCFNFHGMTADTNPVDEFQNLNTTNNAGEYNLLNVTSGACQKPKNAATEVQSSMNIETIVLERLRLSVERILPVTERPINGGYSALQTSAAGGYISANYATQLGNDWDCDTTACTTDPYHVLYYKNEGVSDFACDWRTGHVGENDAKTDSVWSDGDDFFLTGCTDNATSLVSRCLVPLKGLGVCDAFSPPSSVTELFMPPASFPHFYVYAMSTYTASFPQTQSLSNVEQTSTNTAANKVGQTRRLGSKKLLASKSTSQSFSKSMFVISDTHHL